MSEKINNEEPVSTKIIEEKLHVDKKLVETAKVQIIKKIREEEEAIDVSVMSEEVEVKNIPVNQYVDAIPPVRYEGNSIIIPVVQEVVIVEKKLLLVEEVHITKHTSTNPQQQTAILKKQEVIINRIPTHDDTI